MSSISEVLANLAYSILIIGFPYASPPSLPYPDTCPAIPPNSFNPIAEGPLLVGFY